MVRIIIEERLRVVVILNDLAVIFPGFFSAHSGETSGMVLIVIEFDLLIVIFVYIIN